MKYYLILALVVVCFTACRKESDDPDPAIPSIPESDTGINFEHVTLDVFGQHYAFYPAMKGIDHSSGYNQFFEGGQSIMLPYLILQNMDDPATAGFSAIEINLPAFFSDSAEYVAYPTLHFLQYFTNQNFIHTPSAYITLPNGEHLNSLGNVLLGDWIKSYQVLSDTYPARVRCQAEIEITFQHPTTNDSEPGILKFDLVFTE